MHTQAHRQMELTHTQTCSVYTHSHSWIAHIEVLSQCLPDAVVFHFPPTSLSSLTAEINEFIAPSFTYKDTESFTDPRANTESTYSEVSSPVLSSLLYLTLLYTHITEIHLCLHACAERSSVIDEKKTHFYLCMYICVCVSHNYLTAQRATVFQCYSGLRTSFILISAMQLSCMQLANRGGTKSQVSRPQDGQDKTNPPLWPLGLKQAPLRNLKPFYIFNNKEIRVKDI